MDFTFTFNAFYIGLAVYGLALLFIGFNWAKPLALVFGMFLGYMAVVRALPLDGFLLTIVATIVGVGIGFIMFRYYQILPLVLAVIFVFLLTGLIQTIGVFTLNPYIQALIGVVALALGYTAFATKDYALVIWTAIIGALLFMTSLGLLSFGTYSMLAIVTHAKLFDTIIDIFGASSGYHMVMFAALLTAGLMVQFLWTARFQLFVKKHYKGKHRG